ncbi:UNKNOWN [Stylonychia lemnae]|uniref:Uncharacterized protein n=1 Tax=Stylonychia lemnae TaxID=5949 RepID=A0A078ANB6_STYLE|nr:UNKNOWN [Stylonychia lemnae]|eukprot:CDW83664.1 UNKNOWN [Stylonychia lemnae]
MNTNSYAPSGNQSHDQLLSSQHSQDIEQFIETLRNQQSLSTIPPQSLLNPSSTILNNVKSQNNFMKSAQTSVASLKSPGKQIEKTSEDIILQESLQSIKETNHQLKLNDAITRNKIRKTERDCEVLKEEQSKIQKIIAKVEKQHNTDQQYLMKQQELKARYEIDLSLLSLNNLDQGSEIKAKLQSENLNLKQLQDQMQHSQNDSQQCLQQLNQIELMLNQPLQSSQPGETPQGMNTDALNQIIIEVVDVYERSIKRKNGEIDMIKSCLVKEKQKLQDDKDKIQKQVKLLQQKRVQQQKSLCELEKKNQMNQRSTLVDLLISNNNGIRIDGKQVKLGDNLGEDTEKPVQTVSIDLHSKMKKQKSKANIAPEKENKSILKKR